MVIRKLSTCQSASRHQGADDDLILHQLLHLGEDELVPVDVAHLLHLLGDARRQPAGGVQADNLPFVDVLNQPFSQEVGRSVAGSSSKNVASRLPPSHLFHCFNQSYSFPCAKKTLSHYVTTNDEF